MTGRCGVGKPLRDSGIEPVGAVPWGTHFCQFYGSKADLLETVVPFLRAGLEAGEECVWVISPGLTIDDAVAALRPQVADVDRHLASGRLEIAGHDQVYADAERFDPRVVAQAWAERAVAARGRGLEGLRLTGDTLWLDQDLFQEFVAYESIVDGAIREQPIVALCTYPLERCSAKDLIEVVTNHEFALIKRDGRWEVIETSAHQRMGQALRESEERYRALFEGITEGFALHEIVCDDRGEPHDYRFLEVNPAFERLTGLRREETLGRTVREVLPGIEPSWIEVFARVALGGEPAQFEEHASALDRDFEVRAFCPAPGQFASLFTDITERNRAAAVLADHRRDLRRAQEVAHIGSWRLEVDADRLVWSDETYRILGIQPGTPVDYETFLTAMHPDDRARAVSEWQRALDGGPFDVEHRVLVDGDVKWVRERGELELDPTGVLADAFGTIQDITAAKQAEHELQAARIEAVNQHNRLEAVMEALPVGVAIIDSARGGLRCNRSYEQIWGGRRPVDDDGGAEVMTRAWWVDDGLPVGREEWASARAVEHGETVIGQMVEIERPDGIRAFVHNSAAPFFDAQGQIGGAAVAVLDLTELKRKEREAALLNDRLVRAQRSARAGVWEWDPETGRLEWSPELLRLFGLDPEATEADLEVWRRVVHPEDLESAEERLAHALRDRFPLDSEYRIVLPDGTIRWINALGDTIDHERGSGRQMAGICVDVTARKRIEEELRESRGDLAHAQSVARIGSWRLDVRDGGLLWSDETRRIFGIPDGIPMTYESFLACIHTDDRIHVHERWSAALRGEPYDIEHRIVVGSAVKWVRERAELVIDPHGVLLGGFGTVQDVTERKQDEERIRTALQEKEVLLKEVHHRVKNNLQIIASMLNLQLAVTTDEAARGPLVESQNRVRTLALIHEMLYGSRDFTMIPMRAYVTELTAAVQRSFGAGEGRVRVDLKVEDIQVEVGTAIPLALILNELLSNVFKHAFPPGREGRVEVRLWRIREGRLGLEVADDGVGVPPDLDPHRAASMGLQLVSVLTTQLEGVLELQRGAATAFVLELAERA